MTKEEVIKTCKNAAGIIAGTELLDMEVLENLSNLKVLSRCGSGMDNVELREAKRLGIKVFNTPDAPTIAVAELTIGLIISLLRKVNFMDTDIRKGVWKKKMGCLLSGKHIGIIGFGKIGKKVAEFLGVFGCKIAFHDPLVKDVGKHKPMDKESLLGWADIVTLHATSKSCIISDREFLLMKRKSWLINVSRGELVDEYTLYEQLLNGHLAGAAIDVFGKEPYNGNLSKLNNVILTPHIGSYAVECRINMESEAVNNLLKWSDIS